MDNIRASAREILPSGLYWAPGLDSPFQDDGITYANALEMGHCNGRIAEYYVPHYNKFGAAFGPLPLDETLRFCRGLAVHLEDIKSNPLCLTTPPNNDQAHSNAVVLVGAYLIFCEGWSATRVTEVLGKDNAERVFPRFVSAFACWASRSDPHSHLMRVKYCWEGMEEARENDWIDLACLYDDVLFEEACAKYRRMAFSYDSAWLVPGKVLLSSDPITTMCDPNPETFSDFWEQPDDPTETGTASTAATETPTPQLASTEVSAYSNRAASFRSFAQEQGVSLVIRTNYSAEKGMPRPSYDEKQWRTYNIEHIDLPFADGTVPPPRVVGNALISCRNMMNTNPGAVLVHGRSGFGRSVLLACCHVLQDYDVPGSALLGWARICRPGSINTMEQEKYLLSLTRRAVVSHLRAYTGAENSCEPGAKVRCGCVLQ